MDGSRFDALARSLTLVGSRRRALSGLLLGSLGLLGWGSAQEVEAHDPSKKCKKKSGEAKKKCLKKAKQHKAAHANETPPPPCVPESTATTCAPGCGDRLNNCHQVVRCACVSGQTCLRNGTCARLCSVPEHCDGCTPAPRGCSLLTTEGQQVCGAAAQCTSLQPCNPADTTGCPQGFYCIANCSGAGPRCAPVANCPPT